ncbi:B3 domain-containing protein Os01g0234100 [Eucalyptus grandis]|uniref:B3 domain-containing protein Os01g0234100 n=1 Tax=Eucalyptus grandis TaxID=71139 RepID=UPI00192EB326|nr:B3 domain-containing protein Os01g0234100 [Eucalyptus grandis]
MERAKAVQSSLSPQFPSFVKRMLPSRVTRVFWMGFPKQFCDPHLLKEDATIELEDESGDVYIVRSNNFSELDGALGLINLGPCSRRVNPGIPESKVVMWKDTENSEEEDDDPYQLHLAKELSPDNIREDGLKIRSTDYRSVTDHPKTNSDDRVSNGLHGIQFSEFVIDFGGVTSIEDFSIITKGLVIDSELSKHLKGKYYELCRSRKTFLHASLLEGLHRKLAAGIISETVNIADAIRGARITTSTEDFGVWATTLKAFEDLGMDVGFLRAWLGRLISLSLALKRCKEPKSARARAAEDRSRFEAELTEVKGAISRLRAETDTTGNDSYGLDMAFQQVTSAPW